MIFKSFYVLFFKQILEPLSYECYVIFKQILNIFDFSLKSRKMSIKRIQFFIPFTGLFLECPGITSALLRNNLQNIQAPIQSLSIYDFDRTVTTLSNDIFSSSPNGIQIKHIQFSNSNIQALKENSLASLKDSIESLSIQNAKLTQVSFIHWNVLILLGNILHSVINFYTKVLLLSRT